MTEIQKQIFENLLDRSAAGVKKCGHKNQERLHTLIYRVLSSYESMC